MSNGHVNHVDHVRGRRFFSSLLYTTFNIADLNVCIAFKFYRLWATRPCIHHMFRHLTKRLIFGRTGHAGTVVVCSNLERSWASWRKEEEVTI